MMAGKPKFFATPADWRAWLHEKHACEAELVVGFHKKHTGKASITWEESVREALCYGWIDGIRRSVDEASYTVRFTPRRTTSVWSAINIRLIAELDASGHLMPAGRTAFEARRHKTGPKAKGYTARRKDGTFSPELVRAFKKGKKAWEFFEAQPPGYRKSVAWWVMIGKKAETREKRLRKLMEASAAGKRLGWM